MSCAGENSSTSLFKCVTTDCSLSILDLGAMFLNMGPKHVNNFVHETFAFVLEISSYMAFNSLHSLVFKK